jgi:hypothetical protein
MALREEIQQVFSGLSAEFSEKKGITTTEYTVAERKSFLSKKKLTYVAKYRIDEEKKEVRFTEMLKESGSGFSSGGDDMEAGFGFKKETYKTGFGGSGGTIEEQSTLFGKKYSYTFDYGKIRKGVEEKARSAGYGFKYQVTPIGL